MNIALDRRHTFYFDADDQTHSLPPFRFDRLWRGEPDAAMPELAGQRVRFAVLHTDRRTAPPHVVVEHYPVLTFDAHGHVDVELQQAQLHADVDRLEANGYMPALESTDPHQPTTDWRPDSATRRRLLALLTPPASYRSHMTTGARLSRADEPRPRVAYDRTRGTARWQTARRWELGGSPRRLP